MRKASQRLLFVTGTAANVRQGSGTYVGIAALRRALVALGLEVKLIAPRRGLSAWRRLWFNLRLPRTLGRRTGDAVIGFDLDGLFLHSPVAAVKGVLADETRFESGWARLSLALQAQAEKWRLRRARCVITTSRHSAAAIERHYGVAAARIHVVPEMLDVAAWRAQLSAAPERLRRRPVVLCVAHLYRRKDVATLVRAAARLACDAEVRIVGAGPEARRLHRLTRVLNAADRVKFLGHVNWAALAAEYRNADVFCLPSRQEGFGIVLLEAMAAGLPIVAARSAAIPEVVPEPACGCLFPPGDVAALTRTLELVLGDGGLRRDQGVAGRRRAAGFDAPCVAQAFLGALA